jgi:hypothetical protein
VINFKESSALSSFKFNNFVLLIEKKERREVDYRVPILMTSATIIMEILFCKKNEENSNSITPTKRECIL